MKAAPLLTTTNAGELGPALDGRSDLAIYTQGAKVSENFIHKVEGPAVRRGGTRYIAETKDSEDRSWLVEFEFSATQAFILEFGDSYVRFFSNDGANRGPVLVSGVAAYDNGVTYEVGDLVSNGGVNYYCKAQTVGNDPPNATYWYPLTGAIYEIPSPYPLSGLTTSEGTCSLRAQQSGDVLYIAHASRAVKPYKLTRYGQTEWVFEEYAPDEGPFLSLNDTSTSIYASAQSGSVTLTASGSLFTATDVGRLVRLEPENFDVEPWETGKSYNADDLVRSDGKTYKALNSETSGTSQPIHDHGNAFDGLDGVQWAYQDSGYGIARITVVTNSTTATATVITDRNNGLKLLPAGVVSNTNPTTRWQLGAWSGTTGYPSSVTFFKSRVWWATASTLHASVPNDFENMAEDFFGEVRDDCAINFPVLAQDVSDILWIEGGEKLIVGTGGGELVGGEQNPNNPLSPSNFQLSQQSRRRVRGVQPVGVGTSLLYVQRAGRKLLSMDYTLERDRYVSSDQTKRNARITRGGIIDMCYQGEPDSMVWCAISGSGRLAGFTLDAEETVAGWGRHLLGGGGIVESVAAVPGPGGDREDLWLQVRRTINGATRRYIEVMEAPWEGPDEDGTGGDDQEDAFYVDCGLTYEGSPTTTISGLDHLIGCQVQALGDGAVMALANDVVSNAGTITLPRAVSKAHIGFQFISRYVTMRLEMQVQSGTSQGEIKRFTKANIRFVDTLGGECGQYRGRLEKLSLRGVSTPMGQPEAIRSGDYEASFGADHSIDALLEIRQAQPLPMTITSIAPKLQVSS